MKKITVLFSSCLISAFANSALAAMDIRVERTSFYERNKPQPVGFNYTYIDLSYRNSTVKTNTTENTVQSISTKFSFNITPKTSVSLEVAGGSYTFNNAFEETININTGVTYHHPISSNTDIYGSYKIISIEFNDTNTGDTNSASGNAFKIGLRQRIKQNMEWGASATFFNIEDEKHTTTALSFTYGSDDEMQYTARYESADSDDEQTTFAFNVRFNF